MKVLVTGASGQLGYDVIRVLKEKKITFFATDIKELDITNEEDVLNYVKKIKPTVIIHCAAFTAVDRSEIDKELCHRINVIGTRNLVSGAKLFNSKFVYISTDYVFDGEGDRPFEISDNPNPVNYYGKTKYEGELEVSNNLDKYYIIRTSWVFGKNGNNFVKTILKLTETNNVLKIVSDQVGSPTYTLDLSYAIFELIVSDAYGIHHITNDGFVSWYEFTKEIIRQINKEVNVLPVLTKDYKSIARRPLNSRMIKNHIILRSWKCALSHYLENDQK